MGKPRKAKPLGVELAELEAKNPAVRAAAQKLDAIADRAALLNQIERLERQIAEAKAKVTRAVEFLESKIGRRSSLEPGVVAMVQAADILRGPSAPLVVPDCSHTPPHSSVRRLWPPPERGCYECSRQKLIDAGFDEAIAEAATTLDRAHADATFRTLGPAGCAVLVRSLKRGGQ